MWTVNVSLFVLFSKRYCSLMQGCFLRSFKVISSFGCLRFFLTTFQVEGNFSIMDATWIISSICMLFCVNIHRMCSISYIWSIIGRESIILYELNFEIMNFLLVVSSL
ncbi:hypothetical protein HanPSC8_Chr10g0414771 [Helianthus annuus]|nr:hypothetical protein HanPSC8_Chr10g0414771 [Helianthus annuus]